MQGLIATSEGDLERAARLQEASLSPFRARGDHWGTAYALSNLGEMVLQRGDLTGARRHLDESLRRFSELNDAWGRGIVLHALGKIAWAEGDAATAGIHYGASAELFRGIGNRENVVRSLVGVAAAKLSEGEPDEAQEVLTESLAISLDLAIKAGVAVCLVGLGAVQAACGRFLGPRGCSARPNASAVAWSRSTSSTPRCFRATVEQHGSSSATARSSAPGPKVGR